MLATIPAAQSEANGGGDHRPLVTKKVDLLRRARFPRNFRSTIAESCSPSTRPSCGEIDVVQRADSKVPGDDFFSLSRLINRRCRRHGQTAAARSPLFQLVNSIRDICAFDR